MLDFLHTLPLYEANGFLALTYVFWEHLAGILVLASFGFFTARAPAGQRAWTVGAGTLALLAAFLAPTPAPFLLMLSSPQTRRGYDDPTVQLIAAASLAVMAFGYYLLNSMIDEALEA